MAAPKEQLRELLGSRADELISVVCAVWEVGAAAWPAITVRPENLVQRVIARAYADPGAGADHDADLYLAAALSGGNPAALREFDEKLLAQLDVVLGRMRLSATELSEVKQAVRIDLFVGSTGVGAIDQYVGLGPLASWLRVTATRRALKLWRATRREVSFEDLVLASWPDDGGNPERALFKQANQSLIQEALKVALSDMTVRQRNLLRQSVLDELTIDELSLIYRVHRSTCARWVIDARAALTHGTRLALSDALGPSAGPLQFVESDLDISLSRLMRNVSDSSTRP